MKIAFLGDDRYSNIILDSLISYCKSSDKHDLAQVITTRPKPKGRDKRVEPSEVEKMANTHDIKVSYYPTKSDEMSKFVKDIEKENFDLGILTSFGHILPESLLNAFEKGIINVHPSLLPQYRGATPVQHTIALGDHLSGVSVFTLTPKIDDGKLLAQVSEPVRANDTTESLSLRLFEKGSSLVRELLESDLKPKDVEEKEFNNLVFTNTFQRSDGYISWDNFFSLVKGDRPSQGVENKMLDLRMKVIEESSQEISDWRVELDRLFRSLHPWPGIWTEADTKKGKIRIKLTSMSPEMIHIEGKPNPIIWGEFEKYYL